MLMTMGSKMFAFCIFYYCTGEFDFGFINELGKSQKISSNAAASVLICRLENGSLSIRMRAHIITFISFHG